MSQTPPDVRTAVENPLEPEHLEFRQKPPLWVVALKWALIALAVLVLAYISWRLVEADLTIYVILAAFIAMCVLLVYGGQGRIPAKYLLPGVLLMLALQIWPLVYTVSISFTNYGAGHLGTKDQAIAAVEANSVRQVEGSARYQLNIAVPEGTDPLSGSITYLLTDPEGTFLAGDIDGVEELDVETVETNPSGRILSAEGYVTLTPQQVNERSQDLADFRGADRRGGHQTDRAVGGLHRGADAGLRRGHRLHHRHVERPGLRRRRRDRQLRAAGR